MKKIAVAVVAVFCPACMLTPSLQPESPIGKAVIGVASRTPGRPRNSARSSTNVFFVSKLAPKPLLPTMNVSFSLMPLGLPMVSMRWLMMNKALQTMASVSAICNPMRTSATLLRIKAEIIGRISMVTSLSFELRGGCDLARTPRWIQTGEYGRRDGEHDRGEHHRPIQPRDIGVILVQHAHHPQAAERERQSEQAAADADDAGFDDVLREQLPFFRAQRAAQSDLGGFAHELRQQQADGVDQAHEQECERQSHLHFDVFRHHFLILEPLLDVEQIVVHRARESPQAFLVVDVVIQE